MKQEVRLIAAVAANGVIGKAGKIPWHLPADLHRFKRLTLGHTVVMGRSTYNSLGNKPLLGRCNVVLSSQNEVGPVADFSHSPDTVLAFCKTVDNVLGFARYREVQMRGLGGFPLWVIGGAQVYAAFMPYAQQLYITRVWQLPEGDTHFPLLGWDWRLVHAERPSVEMTFEVYKRGLPPA